MRSDKSTGWTSWADWLYQNAAMYAPRSAIREAVMGDEWIEVSLGGRELASDGRIYEVFGLADHGEGQRFLHRRHPLERSEPDKKGRVTLYLKGTGLWLRAEPEEIGELDRFLADVAALGPGGQP
jgi:hypothetical protein